MSRADNSVEIWWNLPISNPKPDLHNINAQTKFGENPLKFTQVIIWKRETDARIYVHTIDGRMERHMDDQRETISPPHYRVVGYKKQTWHQRSKQTFSNRVQAEEQTLSDEQDYLYINCLSENPCKLR